MKGSCIFLALFMTLALYTASAQTVTDNSSTDAPAAST